MISKFSDLVVDQVKNHNALDFFQCKSPYSKLGID